MFTYTATIRRVVDGDTIDVTVDLGFNVFVNERMRLYGIDTPESRTRNLREKKYGKLATARVQELLPVGESFVMRSKSYNKKGKFGRGLVDFDLADGSTICEKLLQEHLAVEYHGQSKKEVLADHESNWDILEDKFN